MTLQEALAFLAAHADKAEVAKGLKETVGGVHQAVFQEGFNSGYGKNAGELATATEKLTTATAQLATVTTERDAARQANPDVAKIHADWQAKLEAKDVAHAAEIQKLQGVVTTSTLSRTQQDAVAELIKQGVKPVHAEAMVERKIVQDRLKVDPITGAVTVFQSGSQIPLAASDGKTPIQLLATELRATATADMIGSAADGGAGGGGGGAATPAAEFTKIRESVKAEATGAAPVKAHGAFHQLSTPTP